MSGIDRSYNPNRLAPAVEFALQTENGVTFHFVDKSSYGGNQWLWDFGDGNTSAYHSPVYTYVENGKYQVSLTVTNQYGTSTATQEVVIKGSGNWLIQDNGEKFTVNIIGDGETTYGEGGLGLDNL